MRLAQMNLDTPLQGARNIEASASALPLWAAVDATIVPLSRRAPLLSSCRPLNSGLERDLATEGPFAGPNFKHRPGASYENPDMQCFAYTVHAGVVDRW